MKKVILSVAVIAAMGLTSCKNTTKQEKENAVEMSQEIAMTNVSFGVRGNCGMCKTTIETAVNEVEGVSKADWDRDRKSIEIAFDDSKTNEMELHKAIAASGYDTEKVAGDLAAYDELPGCCKYDHDMEMNQTVEESNSDSEEQH